MIYSRISGKNETYYESLDLEIWRLCCLYPALTSKSLNNFSVAGPMARSADDLILALGILAGPDELLDGKGYKLALPKARHDKLSDFRVLVIDSHPLCPISNSGKQAIDDLVNKLDKLGVKVSRKTNDALNLKKIAHNYAELFTSFVGGTMPIEVYQEKQAQVNNLDENDDSFESHFGRGFVLSHRDWLNAMRTRQQLLMQNREAPVMQFDFAHRE